MSAGPDPSTPRGHRRPGTVLLDVDDPALAGALATVLAPHHVHVDRVTGEPDAVTAVASRTADLVVVAPTEPTTSDDDGRHRDVALRTGWWCVAADVVEADVVVVVGVAAFDGDPAAADRPDEYTRPAPTTPRGRSWRAAEQQVRDAGGTVVRVAGSPDVEAVAALVRWAWTARAGTWHLDADGTLDDRHTRLVRGGPRGSDG